MNKFYESHPIHENEEMKGFLSALDTRESEYLAGFSENLEEKLATMTDAEKNAAIKTLAAQMFYNRYAIKKNWAKEDNEKEYGFLRRFFRSTFGI